MASASFPPSNISTLPPELYTSLLSQVPASFLQSTALSLSRALPYSPVPLHNLFREVRLDRAEQVGQFGRRLRAGGRNGEEKEWVRGFVSRAWNVDADVLANVLHVLQQLRLIHINIGTTFAPENVVELFHESKPDLHTLSLRFRPYVERATYYQFLKGSYFDSTIETLAQWPSTIHMHHLSIVQDPLPSTHPSQSDTPQPRKFAQPIVFFSLVPFLQLSTSPSLRTLTHLRLRIPSRPILSYLLSPDAYPSLEFLDVATSFCGDLNALNAVIAKFGTLKHLIFDESALLRNEGGWARLGKMCVSCGMTRAKLREKEIKELAAAQRNATEPEAQEAGDRPARRARGRRGVAAATISLRDSPSRASARSTLGASSSGILETKIRILPSPPRLLTLSTSLHSSHTPPTTQQLDDWTNEFNQEWKEGAIILRAAWTRLFAFRKNSPGTRLMMFSGDELIEVGEEAEWAGWKWEGKPPELCFAVGACAEGCGHSIGEKIWLS